MTKCLGCGVLLQDKNINEIGYTDNISNNLCKRCFRLTNYGEYKSVSFSNSDYKRLLKTIPKEALVVYTADILSLNLDRISDYSNVLLVITKRDVIPKSIKDEKIINYIKNSINIENVIVVSSKKNYNIDNLYNFLCKNKSKSIYFVGDTNSGKSTLINKLIKNYGSSEQNFITVSMYPSTTLSIVPIQLMNLVIIDTPGLIDDKSIINYVNKEDLKKLLPSKEIKPKSCQISGSGSIVIDKYVRVDYTSKNDNSIVFYTSNMLNIRFNSLKNDYLKNLNEYTFEVDRKKDIVLPGIGFIKISNPIKIIIYVPNKVIPYVRNSFI
ncbi:MAG: 50S ribosome-binding GTPase [Bacilli bacterium]|nr:50S ribosome-binding GTPase [Bacilli bacterium]